MDLLAEFTHPRGMVSRDPAEGSVTGDFTTHFREAPWFHLMPEPTWPWPKPKQHSNSYAGLKNQSSLYSSKAEAMVSMRGCFQRMLKLSNWHGVSWGEEGLICFAVIYCPGSFVAPVHISLAR